jgi:hypothetical protein
MSGELDSLIIGYISNQRLSSIQILVSMKGAAMAVSPTATLTVGHQLPLSFKCLDQNGNVMLVAPTFDALPAWSNTVAADESLAPSANGMTCNANALSAGTDQINLQVKVGGVAFNAAPVVVTIVPPPQVLTSIVIVPGIPV